MCPLAGEFYFQLRIPNLKFHIQASSNTCANGLEERDILSKASHLLVTEVLEQLNAKC